VTHFQAVWGAVSIFFVGMIVGLHICQVRDELQEKETKKRKSRMSDVQALEDEWLGQ